MPQWLGFAQQIRGSALCRLGETRGGLALLEESLRRLHSTGAALHTSRSRCLLAEGHLLAGEAEATLEHLAAAHRHCATYGERYVAAELHRLEAGALRARGAPEVEVERRLRAAVDLARGQGARLLELRAATDLARLWDERGERESARGLLEPLRERFSEGFALPDLVAARELLVVTS
jgi:predicted ATPase